MSRINFGLIDNAVNNIKELNKKKPFNNFDSIMGKQVEEAKRQYKINTSNRRLSIFWCFQFNFQNKRKEHKQIIIFD